MTWPLQQTALGRVAVPPVVPPGFAVFCTTRDFDGWLTGEGASAITGVARDLFGVTATLATCVQVHGVRVERVTLAKQWRECDSCDALWTDATHTALGIKVADCLPITMVDPTSAVIANIHSGWRGAVQRITAETIDTVTRASAFDAASAFAYLGPSIRVCCFEVGDEVAGQFDARYVDRSRARAHVDLAAFTTDILVARGFAAERVSDSGLCTRCDGSVFHSFRRDGKGGGRNLQIVAQ
jgi:polyphenol oxidase